MLGLAILLAVTHVAHAGPPLQGLAREVVGAGQGVLVVAEDGTVLASEAADRAVHPASVTKIATSLALLLVGAWLFHRLEPGFDDHV